MIATMGLRARAAQQQGYTLVEALVVMLVLGFVLGAIVMVSSAGQRQGVRETETSQAVRDAQTGAAIITHDLRQATQIMPTGTANGMCPATATASCIDFLERTHAFDASQNHVLQRVRLDCTGTYAPPKPDPYATQYRTCNRYVSTSAGTPATALSQVLVLRVVNWNSATFPIFSYRKIDPTGAAANGWVTASPSTDTTSSDAQRINVALQVPARGEGGVLGRARSLLVQDAAELRNVLR